MGDVDTLRFLIAELSNLRMEMMREEALLESRMSEICDLHRESARNLVHYIALRRHDIRDLQEKLTENGLSSIGRAEAHVLGSVDAVLRVLRNLAGKAEATTDGPEAQAARRDRELLRRNTDALLGPPPQDRTVRIMVTMPSAAARDFGLVRDLVINGMDCMRVNCAHDGPSEWAGMISNLQRAKLETGRECRVHMDLGGPKLRTGTLEDLR